MLQSAYQLIDAFWVGRLGGAAVAAVSVSMPVMFLTFAIGGGLAIAGSTLIAQYFGARNQRHGRSRRRPDPADGGARLGRAGRPSASLGAPALLRLMGVAPDVYPGALGFMRVSFVGLVFNFIFFMFQSIMRGIGRPNLPVYIVLGTVILNFVLDPLFIFGWGPVPAYGRDGRGDRDVRHAEHRRGHRHRRAAARPARRPRPARATSFPTSPTSSAPSSSASRPRSSSRRAPRALTVMTFLITSFGTLTLAAYGVGSNVLQVVMIPAMGLSMAVSALVGQNIGAGNIERAARDRPARRAGSASSSLAAFGLLVFLFPPQLVAFFVPNDAEVIAAGAKFLRIMAPAVGLPRRCSSR